MSDQQSSRVWVYQQAGAERAAGAYRRVMAQPNWVVRLTLLAFFLVVGIPIVLLVVLAMFVATLVFGVLVALRSIANLVTPNRDTTGRENVRVVRRVQ